MSWLELPAVKIAISLLLWIAAAPFVWWFFRGTWRELDAEGLALRRDLAARGEIDYRPMVALVLVAFVQTFQEYYGRPFVWWFFRGTWRELDAEGLALRKNH